MLRRCLLAALALASLYWLLRAPEQDRVERRVIAVADLHGDYAHAINVLRETRVIGQDDTNWIAGSDVLVSTGDTVDRGDDTIRLYQLYASLRKQAHKAGGQVINLLGNHEMMNALMDWRYVTQGDIASFGGVQARRAAMSVDGWIGKEWLDAYNVTARIELLPATGSFKPKAMSFVHGGITPHWAKRGIDAINTVGRSFLYKALADSEPDGYAPSNVTKEEMAVYNSEGPFWYRGYAEPETKALCRRASEALKAMDAQFMVMGHTPQYDGFAERCDAQVLIIDTGISSYYGGKQSALVVHSRGVHQSKQYTVTYTFWQHRVGEQPVQLSLITEHESLG
ncbi:hypothetical protein MVES1_000824 [Malassezia vespertilionis]|uniref:Calcineurin-like phosphoesterase domain-containing protein n=1 Tax=Malassezia vespertilionis TaxID=2020962 RepID=A0A2N1JF15_9BASI|nr:uncharacterized protein MVES1_000824 [Malassezia vespertilionis]PKI85106.1 hypothetical protein MVES_000773 [Malassezia vespertilionis]WFD05494.1 hypothetical protein MVES1_000824 [Malassezia vespertilionis]